MADTIITGIIGAMDVEVESIAANMQDVEHNVVSGIPFSVGKLSGKPVVLARCGIGKVNAAVCTQIMLSKFGVNEVINTGVAGAIAKGIKQNDIVIADRFVQHDVDTTAIGDPAGFVSTVNKIFFETDKGIATSLKAAIGNKARTSIGTVATGDQFIADKKTGKKIHERFNAAACDMEGGAIAQVCALAGVPFGAVRCISDSADEKAHMDYPEFAAKAAATCAAMVLEYFKYFER